MEKEKYIRLFKAMLEQNNKTLELADRLPHSFGSASYTGLIQRKHTLEQVILILQDNDFYEHMVFTYEK